MSGAVSQEPRHPIRVASRRAGVSPTLLRAWERRYNAVSPGRSEGGQRLYSDADVERLSLLRQAVEAGRSIGQIVELTTPQLGSLVDEDRELALRAPAAFDRIAAAGTTEESLTEALAAVYDLDHSRLESILTRGALAYTTPVLIDFVLVPLLHTVGEEWRNGRLGPATEHLTTSVVRRFLHWLMGTTEGPSDAPVMVVGTPAGQVHDIGALLVATEAGAKGWRVFYLGSDLPATEIADVARRVGASTVALSALYPRDDDALLKELDILSAQLPPGTRVILGGPSAAYIEDRLDAASILYLPDLSTFREAITLPSAPARERGSNR